MFITIKAHNEKSETLNPFKGVIPNSERFNPLTPRSKISLLKNF